jgi:hypothetical protein
MFYTISILFIFNNIFNFINKGKLDKKFYQKDINGIFLLYFSYYLLSLLYPIWLVFGLFTEYKNIFYILLLINILKFPIYHINKNIYNKYSKISPILSILVLFFLLYTKFF